MITSLVSILTLSLSAGLATGLGGLIAIIRKPGRGLLGFLMGFASGVMIALSFAGLLSEAWEVIGFWGATVGFAIGAFVMFGLDFLLPHIHFSIKEKGILDGRLLKIGILVGIGIALHNIPEGVSVSAGYLHLPSLGIFVALAIGLHNIPEGIATALPIYASGASKLTAFKFALFSGLAEPVGAVAAVLFLSNFQALVPMALAFAAGVMTFITLDELIPLAYQEGHKHFAALGIIVGIISMFILSGLFQI